MSVGDLAVVVETNHNYRESSFYWETILTWFVVWRQFACASDTQVLSYFQFWFIDTYVSMCVPTSEKIESQDHYALLGNKTLGGLLETIFTNVGMFPGYHVMFSKCKMHVI